MCEDCDIVVGFLVCELVVVVGCFEIGVWEFFVW